MRRYVATILAVWITVQSYAYLPTGHNTASRSKPVPNRTIAASTHLKLGTRVYIPGMGWRVVEDRMAKRYNEKKMPSIDIYMTDPVEAKNYGHREIEVLLDDKRTGVNTRNSKPKRGVATVHRNKKVVKKGTRINNNG